jgi:hypothetical protein
MAGGVRGRQRSRDEAMADVTKQQKAGRKGTIANPSSSTRKKLQRQSTVKAGRDETGKNLPHKWNSKTAELVARYSGFGLTDKEIAIKLDLRPGQVRIIYDHELKFGAVDIELQVIETAYKQATSGDNQRATEFWLERRAGWKRPAEKVEVTGAGGGLIRTSGSVAILLPDNGRQFGGTVTDKMTPPPKAFDSPTGPMRAAEDALVPEGGGS